jgi:hypothetical protein
MKQRLIYICVFFLIIAVVVFCILNVYDRQLVVIRVANGAYDKLYLVNTTNDDVAIDGIACSYSGGKSAGVDSELHFEYSMVVPSRSTMNFGEVSSNVDVIEIGVRRGRRILKLHTLRYAGDIASLRFE